MRIVRVGDKYSIVGDEVETYDCLPVRTYITLYDEKEGFLLAEHPNLSVTEKVYGVHDKKVKKVVDSFEIFDRSLGIILSGDKGIGKSIFAKLVCEYAIKKGYPVIIVDEAHRGIAHFIESIEQECIVLFDEFDKTFITNKENDEQVKLLGLFDGIAGGKKMYIVTCNELFGLSNYIVNRPGRFHYHFRFAYPQSEEIREYLQDKIKEEYYQEIDKVIAFAERINLNYDCLRAIAFELNQGSSFKDVITELNILNVDKEEYNLILHYEKGKKLYLHHHRTNLYDEDDNFNWITLYNDMGQEIVDVRYEKRQMSYDAEKRALMIPGDTLKMDYFDSDEEVVEVYQKLKPKYLSFVKCQEKKLHYVI